VLPLAFCVLPLLIVIRTNRTPDEARYRRTRGTVKLSYFRVSLTLRHQLFGRMMRQVAAEGFDPHVHLALQKLRTGGGGYRIIALTNHFSKAMSEEVPREELAFLGWEEGVVSGRLRGLFDDFCDSSLLGMRWVFVFVFFSAILILTHSRRKPEREFYLLACKRNNVRPDEAIFLDDIKMQVPLRFF
jgi:hypothetical protein